MKDTWERALEQVRREGGKPYAIPAGASDHPLGGLGYAHFADELAAQEKRIRMFFDTVVTATCTGSTQAGMVVGFARAGAAAADRHRHRGRCGDDARGGDQDRARHRGADRLDRISATRIS